MSRDEWDEWDEWDEEEDQDEDEPWCYVDHRPGLCVDDICHGTHRCFYRDNGD